jgi:hypothetical protein
MTVEASIESLAAALVARDTKLPICPRDYFAQFAIDDCESDETLPYAGELVQVGATFRIHYSAGMAAERERFTLAHELCHAIFASSGSGWPRRGDELERICELFAAELLMPRWAVDQLWSRERASVEAFRDCADGLGVSLTALANRFATLKIGIVLREEEHQWSALSPWPHRGNAVEAVRNAQSLDTVMLCPDVFSSTRWIRCLIGPPWGRYRYALLLPVQVDDVVRPPMSESERAAVFAEVRSIFQPGPARQKQASPSVMEETRRVLTLATPMR